MDLNNESAAEIKRGKIKNFLLCFGDYEKVRMVRKAKDLNIYSNSEGDEDVYASLMRFATHHDIKIEEKQRIEQSLKDEYIEGIDEDGESKLVRINQTSELLSNEAFKKSLLQERDNLSERLLTVNKLLKLYNIE